MTEAPAVDWDLVVRRSQRRQLAVLPLLGLWMWALVTVNSAVDWDSGWVRGYVALVGVSLLVSQLVVRVSPDRRQRDRERHRAVYGVWHHVDPGPPSRPIADRNARYVATTRWVAWCFPLLGPLMSLSLVDEGLSPGTLLAAGVLCVLSVGYALWYWRYATAARRWMADPPGPPRGMPPATRWERWASPRRLAVICVFLLVVGAAVGITGALLS